MLNAEEQKALVDNVGEKVLNEANKVIEKGNKDVQELIKKFQDQGGITETQRKEFEDLQEKGQESLRKKMKEQGVTISELQDAIKQGNIGGDSIEEKLHKDKDELRKIHSQSGLGNKSYMLTMNSAGKPVLKDYIHGTIDGIEDGSLASVAQSFDPATILRMGANAPATDIYRNTPYIFDLCNTVTTSPANSMAIWMEEEPKEGSSAIVTEGGLKPKVQYKYRMRSEEYKKEAQLLAFTQEFNMDFGRLQQKILENGRTDLINKVNANILPRIEAAAIPYNTATEFKGGEPIANPHDFDVVAAMAAQVDNSTFGGVSANGALVDTFKKYRMGVQRDDENNYVSSPSVLNGISIIGNPDVTTGNITVGDFKQYNILLRGGIIVRVGYNGNDFAENKFSVVIEQFYFDYISNVRSPAIVHSDFATVKGLISV